MVKSAENLMGSNLERSTDSMSICTFSNSYPTKLVPNFRLWMLKIDSKSHSVQTYTMGLTISLNRVSFLPPPVRYNIFYEIETSSTGLYKPGWVHSLSRTNSLQEGAGSRFGEKSLKKRENLGLGPLFAPSFENVWIRPRSTLKKNIGPYIWVYNIV
jgi:hypothetical protein